MMTVMTGVSCDDGDDAGVWCDIDHEDITVLFPVNMFKIDLSVSR